MTAIFLKYLEIVKSNDFEVYLSMIPSAAIAEGFKNAFVLERMGLMICFYLTQKGLYEKELVFLKKIVVLAYSNFFLFLNFLINDLAPSQLTVGLLGLQRKDQSALPAKPWLDARNFK